MYSAAAVANAFLNLARRDNIKLTNMKLQKLVYIAHGWCLALLGRPLLSDEIRAWQWGPVIPNLYESLKKYGAGVVTEPIPTPEVVEPNSQEMAIIESVWKNYGKYPALTLSAITHKSNTPWSQTWESQQYSEIDNDLIRRHYVHLNERSERKPNPTPAK